MRQEDSSASHCHMFGFFFIKAFAKHLAGFVLGCLLLGCVFCLVGFACTARKSKCLTWKKTHLILAFPNQSGIIMVLEWKQIKKAEHLMQRIARTVGAVPQS